MFCNRNGLSFVHQAKFDSMKKQMESMEMEVMEARLIRASELNGEMEDDDTGQEPCCTLAQKRHLTAVITFLLRHLMFILCCFESTQILIVRLSCRTPTQVFIRCPLGAVWVRMDTAWVTALWQCHSCWEWFKLLVTIGCFEAEHRTALTDSYYQQCVLAHILWHFSLFLCLFCQNPLLQDPTEFLKGQFGFFSPKISIILWSLTI